MRSRSYQDPAYVIVSASSGVLAIGGDSPVLGGVAKRAMDLILASAALVILAPMLLIIGALIKTTMGGPVIFAHERIGNRGRPFRCLKFRSMAANAAERLRLYLETHPDAAQEWAQSQKLRHDPRVTTIGHVLRKASLDELPQLVNIIRGEMSFVGPRPVIAKELERYGVAAREYISTRPGLTGMWQVSGRSGLTYEQRVALDVRYVRTWSLWLDVTIIFKTFPAVLKLDETC